MRMELVTVADERGEAIWFVDSRDAYGTLADSRFFPTERAAREWLALNGGA